MENRSCPRLTLVELLSILAALAIIAALLVPAIIHREARTSRVSCVNNLKQICLGFGIWANEQGERFPMQVSTNAGGTFEFISGPNAFVHFRALSNELTVPRTLLCPQDLKRSPATNFGIDLSNSNISYFVGLDAVVTNGSMLLCGDRNITNGMSIKNGILELTTNRATGWTLELHEGFGSVGFSDGSVQQMRAERLREAINSTSLATNRLAMP